MKKHLLKILSLIAVGALATKLVYQATPLPGYPPHGEMDLGPVRLKMATNSERGPRMDVGMIVMLFHWPEMKIGYSGSDDGNRILSFLSYREAGHWGTTGQWGGLEAEANINEMHTNHYNAKIKDNNSYMLLYKTEGKLRFYKYEYPGVFVVYDDGSNHVFADCADGLIPKNLIPDNDGFKRIIPLYPKCEIVESIWNDRFPKEKDGSTPFELKFELPANHITDIKNIDYIMKEKLNSMVVSFNKKGETK